MCNGTVLQVTAPYMQTYPTRNTEDTPPFLEDFYNVFRAAHFPTQALCSSGCSSRGPYKLQTPDGSQEEHAIPYPLGQPV